ncbi:MAG: phosphotransferase, partial [Pseudomonadota bacterium]|nr:phosphotransferase [Pseudomonadota bacterium]
MSDQLELSHDQINVFLKRYEIFEPVLAVDSGAFGNVNANYGIETQTRRLVLQRVGRKKNLDQLRLSSHVANTLFARDFLTPYFHLTVEGDPFIELDGEQFRLMSFVADPVLEDRPSVADALRIVALAEDLHAALNRYFRYVDEGDRRYMTSYQDQPDLIVQAAFERSDLSAKTRERNDSVRPFLDARFDEVPRVRHCHGDIKFGNVIVTPDRVGLLDFENYNVQEWGWEIGDAMRSWFS